VVIAQGEIWWADLGEPIAPAPGYRRPVLVVQCDAINAGRIGAVCVPLTSNLKWGDAPGNVILRAGMTGLAKDSVANVSLLVAPDKQQLTERVRKIPRRQLDLVIAGVAIILGR
jgi:mRNA interferase MazF